MDKASDFESEDCEFESRRGRCNLIFKTIYLFIYRIYLSLVANYNKYSSLVPRYNKIQVKTEVARRFDAKASIAIHNKYSLNYISTLIKLIHIA